MGGSSLTLFFQSSGNSNWKITVRLQPVDTFSLCSLLSCREKRGSCRRLIPAGSKPAWLHGLFHLYETGKKDWALALLPWELSCLFLQEPAPFTTAASAFHPPAGTGSAPLLLSPHLFSFCSAGSLALVSQPRSKPTTICGSTDLLCLHSPPPSGLPYRILHRQHHAAHWHHHLATEPHAAQKAQDLQPVLSLKNKLTVQTFKLKLHKYPFLTNKYSSVMQICIIMS